MPMLVGFLRKAPPKQMHAHFLQFVHKAFQEAYLAEWIESHLLVGVERFDLVLNHKEANSSKIVAPHFSSADVEWRSWPRKRIQAAIYMNCVFKLRTETCLVAVLDADGFLVPLETLSVPAILRRFDIVCGVRVNWVTFDANRQHKLSAGLVFEYFRSHALLNITQYQYMKTVVHLPDCPSCNS
jgi:hypothetical protein